MKLTVHINNGLQTGQQQLTNCCVDTWYCRPWRSHRRKFSEFNIYLGEEISLSASGSGSNLIQSWAILHFRGPSFFHPRIQKLQHWTGPKNTWNSMDFTLSRNIIARQSCSMCNCACHTLQLGHINKNWPISIHCILATKLHRREHCCSAVFGKGVARLLKSCAKRHVTLATLSRDKVAAVSSFFFRRLISKVTERISTKLEHIFTYDCNLKNLVRTPSGIYPHRLGATKLFWDRLWTLTERISAEEHDINNRKENCQSTGTPYMFHKFGELWPETAENGWRVFAHPLNFRIGRHCQPYRMDVI